MRVVTLGCARNEVDSEELAARLEAGGWDLASLSTRHASLEDVFVTLTGRHLRDDEEK